MNPTVLRAAATHHNLQPHAACIAIVLLLLQAAARMSFLHRVVRAANAAARYCCLLTCCCCLNCLCAAAAAAGCWKDEFPPLGRALPTLLRASGKHSTAAAAAFALLLLLLLQAAGRTSSPRLAVHCQRCCAQVARCLWTNALSWPTLLAGLTLPCSMLQSAMSVSAGCQHVLSIGAE
jgi:hypothetical protein